VSLAATVVATTVSRIGLLPVGISLRTVTEFDRDSVVEEIGAVKFLQSVFGVSSVLKFDESVSDFEFDACDLPVLREEVLEIPLSRSFRYSANI